jgi:cell division protein FtsA
VSKKEEIICGLDIGTSKICMMIARTRAGGSLELLSSGYSDSAGLKKGVVVDLEEAAASIRKAADEAESKSGVSVDWVYAGVSGDHVQSFNCHGAISVEGKHHEVTEEDMDQAMHAAQSIPVPPGREIIHALPQEYFLDSRGDIQNPVGLTGSRLDVNVHVVTCDSALLQNLVNAVNKAQMRVNRTVLQQLASAEAVLTPDEKELGAAVIDIGGGTTDVALFVKGSIRFTSVLPVGGAHFTRDLAVGLRTPIEDAERIKKAYGTVIEEKIADDEVVEVPGVGTRSARDLPRKMICDILTARGVELMELVKKQLISSGEQEKAVAGVVLTGGGSMLEGMLELSEQILEMPVRQGVPRSVHGLVDELCHPVYATAIGLAMFGAQESGKGRKRHPGKAGSTPLFINRLLSWVGS